VETADLRAMTVEQLRERAARLGVRDAERLQHDELITALNDTDYVMTRSEEQLTVGTEVLETGRARLRKYVVTEQVQVTVTVRREELRIEREPIPDGLRGLVEDPDVFGPAEVFESADGGVIYEVTLHEERPVVGTEIVPVERVRLRKVVHTDQQTVSDNVQKEVIELVTPDRETTTID
jgi:stress response protein YsnF